MSGLAALFHRDGRPVDRAGMLAMLAAAPYRGPDGTAIRIWDAVALGFLKSAVTPEDEADEPPLVSPRTGCAIVADARLDNRDDLLARLPDGPSPSVSDSALILRAYETWGADAATHLLGDFAFLIWDPRKRRVVGARDTSGQRALFYRIDARTFAAASEIQQLLQDPSVKVAPDDERVRRSLVPLELFRNEKDDAATWYAGVRSLPAGHVLVVDAACERVRRYWDLQPPKELRYRSDEEYAERYRELFSEVVRARLRCSRPIGVLLSGGLDSSSIACTVQQLYRGGQADDRGFATFSSVFDGLACDEREHIEAMRLRYGFAAEYISPGEYAGRLQLEPRGFREAPSMGAAGARDAILGAASRAGARVLLTGDVADSCVYGTRLVFDSLLRRGDLKAFGRHLRAYRRVSRDSLPKILALYCAAPLLPLGLQRRVVAAYVQRAVLGSKPYLLPLWMPQTLRVEMSERHLQRCLEAERGRRFSSESRESDYRLLYPPEVARHPAPWPLEIWRPFADRRLHEFLLAVPPEQKFAPHPDTDEFYAGSKRLVRNAMRGILPECVRTQTAKTVFGAVFERELELQWPAFEAAFGPSARPEVVARGYVDRALFWSRLQMLRRGVGGADVMYILHVVELETWLRTFRLGRPLSVTVPPPWGRDRSRGAA